MKEIICLFDPLCGWCYGASNGLAKLSAQPDTQVRLLPTGLFSRSGRMMDAEFAEYAWRNDEKIAALTGAVFSQAYRTQVLAAHGQPIDSLAAVQSLTAVEQTAPQRETEALIAIQTARYADGLDITDTTVLADILRTMHLNQAAERLGSADVAAAAQEHIESGRRLAQQYGLNGVPALLVREGAADTLRVADNRILFR